jgi:hypothetical protein
VEGDESVGERERFRRLAGSRQDVRFLECGSGKEVLRRVSAIRALAQASDTDIRIGGVIDRDYLRPEEADALSNEHGVFVLPVHEVENRFFGSNYP